MTDLNKQQLQFLKKLTHPLKPVVRTGQHGLTNAVLVELDKALIHHELIKIKIGAADRDERDAILARMLEKSGSALVQQVGGTAVLFRRNKKKPMIELPR
ncbi:MAG: ribosome assembly RNA-binding protein YhbY [Granulosicoccaceae bacterium]